MATISNLFIDQDADFTTTVTINDSTGSALDLTNYTTLLDDTKDVSIVNCNYFYFYIRISTNYRSNHNFTNRHANRCILNLDDTFMT